MYYIENSQLNAISGASQGTYYYNGIGYEFSCVGVSQTCIDTYLSFAGKLPPGSTIPPASLDDAYEACGGIVGFLRIIPCLDPVIEQVRIDNL